MKHYLDFHTHAVTHVYQREGLNSWRVAIIIMGFQSVYTAIYPFNIMAFVDSIASTLWAYVEADATG